MCLSVDEWVQKMWHMYNGILFSLKTEGTSVIHDMSEPERHYAK